MLTDEKIYIYQQDMVNKTRVGKPMLGMPLATLVSIWTFVSRVNRTRWR